MKRSRQYYSSLSKKTNSLGFLDMDSIIMKGIAGKKSILIFTLIFDLMVFKFNAQNLIQNGDFESHNEFGKLSKYNRSPSVIRDWKVLGDDGWPNIYYCHKNLDGIDKENIFASFDPNILSNNSDGMLKVIYIPNCPFGIHYGCTDYLYTKTITPLEQGELYEVKMNVYLEENAITEKIGKNNIGFHLCQDLSRFNFRKIDYILNVPFFTGEIKYNQWTEISTIIKPACELNYIVLGIFKNKNFPITNVYFEFWNSQFYLDNISITKLQNADSNNVRKFNFFCKYEVADFPEQRAENTKLSVFFPNKEFELNENELNKLKKLTIDSNDIINIFGSTDSIGTTEANRILANKRIESVQNQLTQLFKIKTSQFIQYSIPENLYKDMSKAESRKCDIIISKNETHKIFYFKMLFEIQYGSQQEAFKYAMRFLDKCPLDSKILLLFDPRLSALDRKLMNRIVKRIKNEYYSEYKNAISFQLDSLYFRDQFTRSLEGNLNNCYTNVQPELINPPTLPIIDEKQNDSMNLKFTLTIIPKLSFPEIQEYGRRQNKALIYTLIHAEDTIAINKYLPLIEQNCKIGESEWQYYTLLCDRNLLLKNMPQIYGTQMKVIDGSTNIMKIYKFDDLKLMNERRSKINLPAISDTSYSVKLLR